MRQPSRSRIQACYGGDYALLPCGNSSCQIGNRAHSRGGEIVIRRERITPAMQVRERRDSLPEKRSASSSNEWNTRRRIFLEEFSPVKLA
jgi:hypothetical protein